MGVRVEHPQEMIDKIRYGSKKHRRHLPAASYNVAARIDGRGVYSFCMCPGGYVIPASTSSGELVLNGMSMSSRSAPLANAGIVVEVGFDDIPGGRGGDPLALLKFQKDLEKAVFLAGGGDAQKAPAQRYDRLLRTSRIPKPSEKLLFAGRRIPGRSTSFFPSLSSANCKRPSCSSTKACAASIPAMPCCWLSNPAPVRRQDTPRPGYANASANPKPLSLRRRRRACRRNRLFGFGRCSGCGKSGCGPMQIGGGKNPKNTVFL